MKTRLTKTGTRRGFTLVEMMVAMAISLGIMLILAEAFKSALDFVRIANANAQLMNQLSGAGNMLEHDLLAEHFLSEPGKPNGGVKLSDQWLNTPPKGGFFHIDASSPTYLGFTDREGNTLSYATNHRLQFTSIFKGGTDAESFVALWPAGGNNIVRSRAAEVAYFLVPTGDRTSINGTALPLFNLVRRYRIVAMDDDSAGALNQVLANDVTGTAMDVISVQMPLTAPPKANTLITVTNAANRLIQSQFPTTSPRYGEDIVATNVLSFQVMVWYEPMTFNATLFPRPYTLNNTDAPYDYLATGVFDTAAPAGTPGFTQSRVRGLQITLRIADLRVGIARSNTWKFAM